MKNPFGFVLRFSGDKVDDPLLLEMDNGQKHLNLLEERMFGELHALTERTGMPLTQENGQRRYGPPLDPDVPVPSRGCEVFVGKIPRDCFEPELVPVFERAGQIYEIRLMMDFSGTNRGYCFVQYFTPAEANRAIVELNGYEIRRGRRIGVVKSVDNCRLYFGGIPKDKRVDEIGTEVNKLTEGIVKVVAYPSQENNEINRGYAFVEYENHKAAAIAKRKLIPGNLLLWNTEVLVEWADPEPEAQILFVKNLSPSSTEQTIAKAFNSVSDDGVKKVAQKGRTALVHFCSNYQAEMAKYAMQDKELDGSRIQVSWDRNSTGRGPNFQKHGNKIRIEFEEKPHDNQYGRDTRAQNIYGLNQKSNYCPNQSTQIRSENQLSYWNREQGYRRCPSPPASMVGGAFSDLPYTYKDYKVLNCMFEGL